MMSDYWRSEVRIREFVNHFSILSIQAKYCKPLAYKTSCITSNCMTSSQQRLHLSTDVSRQNLSNLKHVCSVHALYVPHSQVLLCVCVWVATQQVYPPEFSVRDWQLILPSIADGRIWLKYLGTALIGQLLPLDVYIWYEGRGAPRWNEKKMYTLCYESVVRSFNGGLISYNDYNILLKILKHGKLLG